MCFLPMNFRSQNGVSHQLNCIIHNVKIVPFLLQEDLAEEFKKEVVKTILFVLK